jgi:hypothetical protein
MQKMRWIRLNRRIKISNDNDVWLRVQSNAASEHLVISCYTIGNSWKLRHKCRDMINFRGCDKDNMEAWPWLDVHKPDAFRSRPRNN